MRAADIQENLLVAEHIRRVREPIKARKWMFRLVGTVGGGGGCSEPELVGDYIRFICYPLSSIIMTPQTNPLLELDFQARYIWLHEYDKAHPWYGAATLGESAILYQDIRHPSLGNIPDDIA